MIHERKPVTSEQQQQQQVLPRAVAHNQWWTGKTVYYFHDETFLNSSHWILSRGHITNSCEVHENPNPKSISTL